MKRNEIIIWSLVIALLISLLFGVVYFCKYRDSIKIQNLTFVAEKEYIWIKTARTEKGLWDKQIVSMNGYSMPITDKWFWTKRITVGRFE